MNYFIYTFEIYLDSVYKAGGKVGMISLLKSAQEKGIIRNLTEYYTKVFSASGNIEVKILKVDRVQHQEYILESDDFVKL